MNDLIERTGCEKFSTDAVTPYFLRAKFYVFGKNFFLISNFGVHFLCFEKHSCPELKFEKIYLFYLC